MDKMSFPKIQVLAIAAHPDDAELGCSGTLLRHKHLGYSTGILDLTAGDLGTRGNMELRLKEADAATKILNLTDRRNLFFRDGFFKVDEFHTLELVKWIRAYRPELVLCNAPEDRHPDHGRAGKLAVEACFYSGLTKIQTRLNGVIQEAWRPGKVLHYIQDRLLLPSLVVDITPWMDIKIESIQAFKSQFYSPEYTVESKEPETYISSSAFKEQIIARARIIGHMSGVEFGEGFISPTPVRVDDLVLN